MVAACRIYECTSPIAPERQLSHLEFHIEVDECLVKYVDEAPSVRLGGPKAPIPNYIR